jgi:hypothetical protein
MNTITLTYDQLQNIVASSQKAFIETGKYYLTKREAYAQFGRPMIDILLTNKLLKDARPIKAEKLKCRFLLTDILTAVEIFKSL